MSYATQIKIHMILMIVFLVFALSGIITAKFFKKKTSKWLNLHKTFMIISVLSALSGFVWIFYVVQTSTGYHFTVLHTILGLVTLVLVFTAPALGLRMTSRKTSTNVKPALRVIHKTVGWVALLLILVTVMTGLSLFGIIYLPF